MAKRSRRARRQEAAKPKQTPNIVEKVADSLEEAPAPKPAPAPPQPAARKVVNFAQEYLYVYTELRNVLIVALIMFALMFGLAYFI